MTGTEIIFTYLGIINVVTFLTYGADKSRAQSGRGQPWCMAGNENLSSQDPETQILYRSPDNSTYSRDFINGN